MKYFMCIVGAIYTLQAMITGDSIASANKCRCLTLLTGICFVLAAVLEILG